MADVACRPGSSGPPFLLACVAGRWAVAAVIDSTYLVPETDERNNHYIHGAAPQTPGGVDLEIVSAGISESQLAPNELHQSDSLVWTCTVRNNSAEDSGDVWFELFPSTTGGLDFIRMGTTLTSSEKRGIAAGQTATFTFTQPFNAITDGIYSAIVHVNRQGTGGPNDPNQLNNRCVMPGRVFLHNTTVPSSNLVWSEGPTVSEAGGQVTVTGTICNSGTAASGPFWTESFYGTFSAENFYMWKGTLAAGQYCAGLAPEATVAFSQTAPLPPGSWVVGVLADSTDIVPEMDETDNYDYLLP